MLELLIEKNTKLLPYENQHSTKYETKSWTMSSRFGSIIELNIDDAQTVRNPTINKHRSTPISHDLIISREVLIGRSQCSNHKKKLQKIASRLTGPIFLNRFVASCHLTDFLRLWKTRE